MLGVRYSMKDVRLGIIGVGVIGGKLHSKYLMANEVKNLKITAVCDIDDAKLQNFKDNFGDGVKFFTDYKKMLHSGEIDAVLIATPHYDHPVMAMDAFKAGMHVLIEKPAGVFVKNVLEMNKVAEQSGKVFSIMYCLITVPYYINIKDMISSGELGDIKRINWIITNCYRPQSYHDSSSWRSSWKGEGGGVLINQCPHHLDLWQWIFGMPSEITAFIDFGKYYNIEVDDDVTAYLRYPNGVTGVFIASTGETPGTNRLEIMGTMGKMVLENNKIIFNRNRISEREFNAIHKNGSSMQTESWECIIPVKNTQMEHKKITQNFINAIINGEELIAPGENGVNQLILSNAMYLSAWTKTTMTLPLDHDMYYKLLQEKINESV